MDENGLDDSSDTDSLLAALANNAESAFTTYEIANAPVPNAALIAGGTGSSAVGSATSISAFSEQNSSLILVVIAVIVIALFAFMRR